MRIHCYYVYILTNKNNTVLYTGVTNNLVRRCFQHIQKLNPGFTAKYNVSKLVYFEFFDYINDAILREKQIKGYSRAKKKLLIDKINPDWNDLYQDGKIFSPHSHAHIRDENIDHKSQ